MIDGYECKPLKVERRVRQVCPISPLLVTMAIEMLAMAVSSNQMIQGVKSLTFQNVVFICR